MHLVIGCGGGYDIIGSFPDLQDDTTILFWIDLNLLMEHSPFYQNLLQFVPDCTNIKDLPTQLAIQWSFKIRSFFS